VCVCVCVCVRVRVSDLNVTQGQTNGTILCPSRSNKTFMSNDILSFPYKFPKTFNTFGLYNTR